MNWVIAIGAAATAIVVFYQWFFFRKIKTAPEKTYPNDEIIPVSIIICAKNEAANLAKNLKIILMQHYPAFEVIVVNDQSSDNSAAILDAYSLRNPHLRIINIAESYQKKFAGKKNALIAGVSAAKNEHIIVTDADCQPDSTHWIQLLSNRFFYDTAFVLGYAPFYTVSGFWNKIMQFENYKTALFSLSFALRHIPVFGIGRNMGFTKSVFLKNNYAAHAKIMSGDDDLLVNQLANEKNTAVVIEQDAFVYSYAPENFKKWLQQKTRHLEAARFYKKNHLTLIHLYIFANFVGYCFLCYTFFIHNFFSILIAFLFVFSKIIHFYTIKRRLLLSLTPVSFIFIDFIYIFFEILLLILFVINPKKEWK